MQPKKAMKLLLSLVLALCLYLGAAIAEEDTGWMPDNYTKLQKVPVERIITGMPQGLVAQCNVTDGMIEFVIDTDATDWEQVLAYSYQSSSGQAYVRPGMKPPAGAAGHRSIGYSVDPGNHEDQLIASLQADYDQYGVNRGNVTNGYWIGRYEESTSLYVPLEYNKRPHGIATLWYDEDGNMIRGEYLLFTISYTDTDARTVHMAKVPASDITLNVPAIQGDYGTTVHGSKDEGVIRYEVSHPEDLLIYDAVTAIAAPQIDGRDPSGWTCYVRNSFEDSFSAMPMADAGEYGLTRRSALLYSWLSGVEDAQQYSHTIEWRDENGKPVYIAMLSSIVVCGDPAPWPAYEAGWKPVPKSRLNLTYIDPIESGTKLTYDERTGIAYFHIDAGKLPETAAYGDAHYVMEFLPPEGATAYAFANGNTDNAFGEHTYMGGNAQSWMEQEGRHPYDEGFTIGQPLFDTYRQSGKNLTLFMTAQMPGEFAAEYTIINWYRDINDEEPMATEYVFRQMDSCILQHVSTPVSSEEELPEVISTPAIVIPNNNSAKQMKFIAEIYPQESENARYYELRLVDEKGKDAHLPAKAKIILPYPEGTSFENAKILFSLRHLNNKHQTIETFSEEDGTLHREKDYLWFTPSSLSPFILEWTGGVHSHKLEYDIDPDDETIMVQYCRTCDHVATAALQVADKAADGKPVEAQIIYSENWAGEKDLAIIYVAFDEDGNVLGMSDFAPDKPGSYAAFIEGSTCGTADVYFSILPPLPAVLPSTGDHSMPPALLAMLAAASTVLLLQLRRRRI